MESFLMLLAREGHWNIRWKVTVLPSSSAKWRQTNATSFPYQISSYLGTSLPGRIETPRWETQARIIRTSRFSQSYALILCCSETVRDIDPSASGMMMQMVLSKDNRYAAAFTRWDTKWNIVYNHYFQLWNRATIMIVCPIHTRVKSLRLHWIYSYLKYFLCSNLNADIKTMYYQSFE